MGTKIRAKLKICVITLNRNVIKAGFLVMRERRRDPNKPVPTVY